jgi:hypothetical protein
MSRFGVTTAVPCAGGFTIARDSNPPVPISSFASTSTVTGVSNAVVADSPLTRGPVTPPVAGGGAASTRKLAGDEPHAWWRTSPSYTARTVCSPTATRELLVVYDATPPEMVPVPITTRSSSTNETDPVGKVVLNSAVNVNELNNDDVTTVGDTLVVTEQGPGVTVTVSEPTPFQSGLINCTSTR